MSNTSADTCTGAPAYFISIIIIVTNSYTAQKIRVSEMHASHLDGLPLHIMQSFWVHMNA